MLVFVHKSIAKIVIIVRALDSSQRRVVDDIRKTDINEICLISSCARIRYCVLCETGRKRGGKIEIEALSFTAFPLRVGQWSLGLGRIIRHLRKLEWVESGLLWGGRSCWRPWFTFELFSIRARLKLDSRGGPDLKLNRFLRS